MQEERDNSNAPRFFLMIGKLVLAQALWLLSFPVLAAGIGDSQQTGGDSFEQGSDSRQLAVAGMIEWRPEADYLQQLPPAIPPLTLAQSNSAPRVPGSAPMWRFGVTGIVNTLTLHRGSDAQGDSISYSIINPPFAGITQDATSPWVFEFPANKAVGVYTVTVRWSDGSLHNTKTMRYGVVEPATMGEWKLDAQGRPRFVLTGGAVCATGSNVFNGTGDNRNLNQAFGAWYRAMEYIKLDFKYNDGPTRSSGFQNFWSGIGCDNSGIDYKITIGIGDNGADTRITTSAMLKNLVIPLDSVLSAGTHNYKIQYSIRGTDVGGSTSHNSNDWVERVFYVSEEFEVIYVKASSTVVVPEVGANTAPSGHKLGTLTLSSAVPGASWVIEGTPATAVNLVPVSGSETSEVELQLGAAAALKATNSVVSLTVSAVGKTGTQHFHTYTELGITVAAPTDHILLDDSAKSDLTELARTFVVPVRLGFLPASSGMVTLTINSSDPGRVAAVPNKLVFDSTDWESMKDVTISLTDMGVQRVGMFSVSVTVAVHDSANAPSNYQSAPAMSVVANIDIVTRSIDLGDAFLSSLTEDERYAVLSVRVSGAPIGGVVTLSLTSDDANDVAIFPDHLEFNSNNWNTGQDVTVSLTQAGAGNAGLRAVNVNFAVHDSSNAPVNFQAASAKQLAVPVNVGGQPGDTRAGQIVYRNKCVDCHGADGSMAVDAGAGLELRLNDDNFRVRASTNKAFIINTFLNGITHKASVNVSSAEIAAVMNYVYSLSTIDVVMSEMDVEGGKVFDTTCATSNCHGKTGGGNLFVSPIDDAAFRAKDRQDVFATFLNGATITVSIEGNNTTSVMPGYRSMSSQDQVNVLSYVYHSINNLAPVNAGHIIPRLALSPLVASIDENIGGAQTPQGTAIVTIGVPPTNTNSVTYRIVNQPDGDIFEIDSTTGVISLAKDFAFDREMNSKYTLTLRVTEGRLRSEDVFVLTIDDIDENPILPGFANRRVANNSLITFIFPEAIDPEGQQASLVYSAKLAADTTPNDPSDDFPAGLSFNTSTRTFTVAAGATRGTHRIKVRVEQSDDNTKFAEVEFDLQIVVEGVDVNASGLGVLTRDSTTGVLALDLAIGAPVGGNVTLTLTGSTHIAVMPSELVFSSGNWNIAQNATVSISSAGFAVKGMRNVQLTIAVYDRSSSATNYQVVEPVSLAIALDITNDNPVFPPNRRSRSINENIGLQTYPVATTINGPITAEDRDNSPGELTYELVGASSLFAINSSSGQLSLKVAANLNYESPNQSYQVTVKASDDEAQAIRGHATVTVTIDVLPVNEPPVLPELDNQAFIAELGGTSQFGRAVDPENDAVTYTAGTLQSDGTVGNLPNNVTFDAQNRRFTYTAPLVIQTVTVRVTSTDAPGLASHGDFTLRIRDGGGIIRSSDALEPFTRSARTEVFQIKLSRAPSDSTAVVTLTITSIDGTDSSRVSEHVAVMPATLEFDGSTWNTNQEVTMSLTVEGLNVKGILAIADISVAIFNQSASDNFFQSSPPVIFSVNSNNPNLAPQFNVLAISSIALALDENVGVDTMTVPTDIGSPITATDEDNDDNQLLYSLVEASSDFGINLGSGQLSAKIGANFNYERQQSYELMVRVNDGQTTGAAGLFPQTATVTVTVNINNIDETPNDYTNHGFALSGAPLRNNMTIVWSNDEYEAQFDNVDRGSIEVSYGGGRITGTVTLAPSATRLRLTDLAPGVSYNITLLWYSADNVAQTTPVTQSGQTRANAAPAFGSAFSYSLAENTESARTPSGYVIGTVSATDADGDEISYRISSGADAALFAIETIDTENGQQGVISLAREHIFDHEGKDRYAFSVAATDIYGQSGTQQVMLEITDVAEGVNLPVQFVHRAVEGMQSTIMVRPAPAPDSGALVYSSEFADRTSWLDVNPTNGQLTVDASAIPGTYQVIVQVEVMPSGSSLVAVANGQLPVEFNEPAFASERMVSLVIVSTVSTNNVPAFASDPITHSFNEGEQSSGFNVGSAAAIDGDVADPLSYELRGIDSERFEIDEAGMLTVKDSFEFDHEYQEMYSFVVDVRDDSDGVASAEVQIAINDLNEAPKFLPSAPTVYVGRRNSRFFVSPAFDEDDGDTISYTYNGPDWLTFSRRALRFMVGPNAPISTAHEVTITAQDGGEHGALPVSHVFSVKVQSGGNQPPSFTFNDDSRSAFEFEILPDDAVGQVYAFDPDNDSIVYSIVPGLDADKFKFKLDDGTSGEIVAKETLAPGEYQFLVEAVDESGASNQALVKIIVIAPPPTEEEKEAAAAAAQQYRKAILSLADRAVATAVSEIIKRRLGSSAYMQNSNNLDVSLEDEPLYMRMGSVEQQWADWRYDHKNASDGSKRMEWQDFLYSHGFEFALGDEGDRRRGHMVRLWGGGSRPKLDGAPKVGSETLSYDGNANLFMLGWEMGVPQRRIGIASGKSRVNIKMSSSGENIERDMYSMYPYFSYEIFDGLDLWAAGGLGRGEFMSIDSSDNRITLAAKYLSAAGGFEKRGNYKKFETAVGLDVIAMQSELGNISESKFWRMIFDIEVGRPIPLSEFSLLRPFIGANIRRDGGDDAWLDGQELDASAGFSLHWSRGLAAEISSRLQTDDGHTNERMFSGSISYDLDSDGRGLMLSASPTMTANGEEKFEQTMKARVGYGFPVQLFADGGLATVSADINYASADMAASYGFRFAGRRLGVDLLVAGDDVYRLTMEMR